MQKSLRNSFRVICVVALTLLSGCSSSKAAHDLVGKPSPSARLTMLDGSYVSLANLRGKTVVLMFWASWCSKSRSTIQELNEVARSVQRPDVVFLADSIDKHEREEKLKDFVNFQSVEQIKQAYSGNDIYDEAYIQYGLDEIPHIFVIGPDGMILAEGDTVEKIKCSVPGVVCGA